MYRLFLLSEPMIGSAGFLRRTCQRGCGRPVTASRPIPLASRWRASVTSRARCPPGINGAELDTAVVPAAGGGSLLRADAAVIWYPARSAAEQVDPARYRAAVVSVTLFNPRQHTVRRTITSGGVIAGLAALVDGLYAAPYQPPNCPAIWPATGSRLSPRPGRPRRSWSPHLGA